MIESPNWIAQLPPVEQADALRRTIREVFSTPNGAIVLTALLEDLCFNREAETEAEKVLKNFATFYITERIGISLGHSATVALLNTQGGA